MRLLNEIVLRAPGDSPILPIAFKLRGNCLFQQCRFEVRNDIYRIIY